MKLNDQRLADWFDHRMGRRRLSSDEPEYVMKWIQATDVGEDLIDTYGESTITAFIGFIDLAGFSEKVQGLPSRDAKDYLDTFFSNVLPFLLRNCAIDKTIGDEILFILPDRSQENGPPSIILMGQVLGGLYAIQKKLGPAYIYRLGLSYGSVDLMEVAKEVYGEWTIAGEVVNLAKRLHGLPEIDLSKDFGGAFGMLASDPHLDSHFVPILKNIAGTASSMTYREVEGLVNNLKGISPSRCAILFPKK